MDLKTERKREEETRRGGERRKQGQEGTLKE